MDQPQNPKQQIVEKLKNANNVLITVSSSPSIDQLASAIGLALMLDKLDKHATAVFSGETPSAIEFLNPGGNIHKNTDSLQDFIISLDASKADKLRYKREGEVAKIFITPYKSSISQEDLTFSQGDVNVDVVVALGVDQKEHLDQAIVSHGRILHDATVLTIMAGNSESNIGSINWQDPSASSLAEMITSISEAFQSGLIDAQIATAFLTGIVAETERFKNGKTTPKVMTMSAQLMSAGANQQLVADNLGKPEPIPEELDQEPEPAQEEAPTVPGEPQPEPEQNNQDEPAKKVGFKNEQPVAKKDNNSSDVLSFNMHDIDGNVSYDGDESKLSEDGIEVDLHADRIHIDQEGNLKAEEEAKKAEAELEQEQPKNQADSEPKDDEPFKNDQIAATGSLQLNKDPKANTGEEGSEENSDDPDNNSEGGQSYALNKGLKVIQPLPPEDESMPPPSSTPVMPETQGRTLDEIEARVTGATVKPLPSDAQAVIESAMPLTQDEARQQVSQAINYDLPNAAPKPIEALNAVPLEESPESPETPQVQSSAPPLPPPPLDPTTQGPGITLPLPPQG